MAKACRKHGDVGRDKTGRCFECVRAAKRRYYEKHKPLIKAAAAAYAAANPERRREIEAAYRARHPGRILLRNRRASWRASGIDPDQAERLLTSHSGRCALCNADRPGGKGDWHVDHNHETGIIRGILCAACNKALGMFKDNPAVLRRAAEYLEASACPSN